MGATGANEQGLGQFIAGAADRSRWSRFRQKRGGQQRRTRQCQSNRNGIRSGGGGCAAVFGVGQATRVVDWWRDKGSGQTNTRCGDIQSSYSEPGGLGNGHLAASGFP